MKSSPAPHKPTGQQPKTIPQENHQEFLQRYAQSYAAKMKGRAEIKRIFNALKYSWQGLCAACEEQGFRQLLWLNAILFIAMWLLPLSMNTRLILILMSSVNLCFELLNTAIEAAVDFTSLDHHILAGRAKDTASAAQYLSLMALIVLWVIVLIDLWLS